MLPFLLLALLTLTSTARADNPQPYAGEEARTIKALDPERMAGLGQGAGLGYAKAAELNGWPGPLHALELRDALGLSDEQVRDIQTVRTAMLAEAIALGQALIDAEQALDQRFAADNVAPSDIDTLTQNIAMLEGQLRAVHLKAHLSTTPRLSRHQRNMYAHARGYSSTSHQGKSTDAHSHKH